jgi:hypothetical protein
MPTVIYLVTFLIFCLGVALVYLSFRARKRAVAEHEKIQSVFDQAERALALIQSEDPDDIIVGLGLLSAYDIAAIRIKAFPRLMQLTNHQNKQVTELAERIIKLCESAEILREDVLTSAEMRRRSGIAS